jgi:hypothetical protein
MSQVAFEKSELIYREETAAGNFHIRMNVLRIIYVS